jgi:hypothetical protein
MPVLLDTTGQSWRPPAGRPLGRVEEVVTSRNHQRIDRPLLPERRPSGRLVSGTRGWAGVSGHAGVHGRTAVRTGSSRLLYARYQRGHRWSLRSPSRTCSLYDAGRTQCPGRRRRRPLRARAHASEPRKVSMGWCPARDGHLGGRPGTAAVLPRTPPDTSAVAVRDVVQVPDTRGRFAASGVRRPVAEVARGTGRRVDGRWWDAANAGRRGRAGRSGGRGADRGRRSSPGG